MIDAVMGFQMQMAPRVVVLSTIPSLPIRVDVSILAGCVMSVPWVKSLLHPGSSIISNQHPMYKTYVDDVANISVGYAPKVQEAMVQCALAFNSLIVVKRKFRMSPKSAIVASDKKLAYRVSKELASYGIHVQVCDSTRDVGVMFTAGVSRDMSISNRRMCKARRRTARICRVSAVTRSARKLFTSGSYPQALWGHQCVGVSPSQLRELRRMAASTTGISIRSQRCLTSCLFVCFGRRGDPGHQILKENVMLWSQLMPIFYNKSHLDLAVAWSSAKQSVVQGPTPHYTSDVLGVKLRWRNVTGPISNIVATLYSIGWNPVSFSSWHAPNGDVWNLPTTIGQSIPLAPLVYAMQDQYALNLWSVMGKA